MKLGIEVIWVTILLFGSFYSVQPCFPPCGPRDICMQGRCIFLQRQQAWDRAVRQRARVRPTMAEMAAAIISSGSRERPADAQRDTQNSEESQDPPVMHDHVRDNGKHFSFESSWLVPWMPIRRQLGSPRPAPSSTKPKQSSDSDEEEEGNPPPTEQALTALTDPRRTDDAITLLEGLLGSLREEHGTNRDEQTSFTEESASQSETDEENGTDSGEADETSDGNNDESLDDVHDSVTEIVDDVADDMSDETTEIDDAIGDSPEVDDVIDDLPKIDDADDTSEILAEDDASNSSVEVVLSDESSEDSSEELEGTDSSKPHSEVIAHVSQEDASEQNDPHEILDTWTDEDTENMKEYGFKVPPVKQTTQKVPLLQERNRPNNIKGFSGSHVGNKHLNSDDSEDEEGTNTYALAAIPIAIAIVAIGLIFLYCKYRKLKKREMDSRAPGAHTQMTDEVRKISSGSTSGLINNSRISIASMAPMEISENVYVDILEIDSNRSPRKLSVAAQSAGLRPIQEHPDLKMGDKLSCKVDDAPYAECDDQVDNPPPSYNEAVYTEIA